MSKNVEFQNKTVVELTEALKKHLLELNYSNSSCKTYGCILNNFAKYCEEKGVDYYDIQVGRDFVWDNYGFVLGGKGFRETTQPRYAHAHGISALWNAFQKTQLCVGRFFY